MNVRALPAFPQGRRAVPTAPAIPRARTADEIEKFKDTHPLGTRPRLAFDILCFTAGRREDAIRLGHQHVHDGRVRFRQAKNEKRNPVDVDIPLHPDLAAGIAAAASRENLTLLTTAFGKPYTPAGFGNAFGDWVAQAGLSKLSPHGLRATTATPLADAGASPHEIASVTGHRSLQMVQHDTAAAERKRLADKAIKRLKKRT